MRAAVQLLQCKTSFLWQLWPQQPKNELKWLQYKIYGAMQHREYERQASNIEEIKQQVAELQQTINTAFERHDFRISPGRTETALRWGGKTNHHSLAYSLSPTYLQRLPKSVDVHWSYSVQHQCRFFEPVYMECSITPMYYNWLLVQLMTIYMQ